MCVCVCVCVCVFACLFLRHSIKNNQYLFFPTKCRIQSDKSFTKIALVVNRGVLDRIKPKT